MSEHFEIAVIGAGMAGASIAAELAPHAKVLLAEAEHSPGYHTTGRSAAFWEECYGGPALTPLTLASYDFLQDRGMLSPRGALYVARAEQAAELEEFCRSFDDSGVHIDRVGRDALAELVPGLREEWTIGLTEPACADIDVAALHQHYLSTARQAGTVQKLNARMEAAEREGDRWRISFGKAGEATADVLVDAAGAWADDVAELAGADRLGIEPYRRTIAQLRTDPVVPDDLPLVLDLAGDFYFKPESGRLWLSPHDETPTPPCDAAPEELDVAIAIDRFEKVVDWQVRAVERKWAGLRTFAPDRLPVFGYDSKASGFFWFAGQGGSGIQTAPAAARLGARLLLGMGKDAMTERIVSENYSPARFG